MNSNLTVQTVVPLPKVKYELDLGPPMQVAQIWYEKLWFIFIAKENI